MSGRKKQIVPQNPIPLTVTKLAHDGRGIARNNDKIVFVFGALPGETVLAKYTRCYSRYDEATTVEVITSSDQRVSPPCPHFALCGGCQLQHLAPTAQVAHKQAILQELLTHQAKVSVGSWMPPLIGDSIGYRQKARLGVRYVPKKEALLVGFREQGNNKLAVIDSCQVLDPRVGQRIRELRDLINSLKAREFIPQIEVAIDEQEVGLVFRHVQPLVEEDVNALQRFAKTYQFSLYLQPGGVDSVHKIWPPLSSVDLCYTLPSQQLSYLFHPLDFTQVNQRMNQQMINQALALLNPKKSDVILDLFCGLGNFSLPLAQRAQQVIGIEGAPQMIDRAKQNAKRNQLHNVDFYTCDLSRPLAQQEWMTSYDKILLDPPRCGAEQVVSQIALFKAKEILYISCNPATFVRDAAILVHQQGFTLVKAGVMDMFPHTAHVETMGLFQY